MSYLLFMDESGHDHSTMPYEVRGGVALHASKVWPLATAMRELEENSFGDLLHKYRTEPKGYKLLDKDRFKWAQQDQTLEPVARRKHALAFLNKGLDKRPPTRTEFTAYGQACLEMARGVFELLRNHEAKLFASMIPRGTRKPPGFTHEDYLRKDHVFLLERFFYFLEAKQEHGLIVMDETDKTLDRRFVRHLESYFVKTHTGRYRAHWIVPSPFFVSSDMTYPVQAADICIYCINWGFRLPSLGVNAPVRQEVATQFGRWVSRLQFRGQGYKDGQVFDLYGICLVPDPYTSRS